MSKARPRPKPCSSCPYRRDAPSGLWAPEEYAKLPPYDNETAYQPLGVFFCHQADGTVCAGWASVHGDRHNLSLRFCWREVDADAVIEYQSPVPVFGSGTEAAEHGMARIEDPGFDVLLATARLTELQERRERKK